MKILNNKRPKRDLWGTLLLTYGVSLEASFTRTRCLRFVKYVFFKFKLWLEIPLAESFESNKLVVSNQIT